MQADHHPPMALSTLAVVVVANAVRRLFRCTEPLFLRPVPIFASLIQMMRNKHRRRPIHLFVRTHCFHRRRHRLLPNSLLILAPQLLLLMAPSVHRKKFRVAWYWNLRFFISEYLQDTQDGVSQASALFLKMYQVLFSTRHIKWSSCNSNFRGQPAGQIDWLLHSSSLYTYPYPI